MASAGTASIDVQGDFSGFTQGAENAGKNLIDKAGGWSTAIKAAIAPAFAIGAIVGLEQIGASFDDAFDKIRISTGQTGKALEGLQGSFKNVLSEVPASMDTVAAAITTVNQRLGLTGKPLEDLSKQFVNLSRITDTDLSANVDAATGVFNQFGISADKQGSKLDELFRVTQSTGISFGDLTSALGQGGVAFRNAGLTFEESAGLLGLLAKNGLSASDVLPSLSRSMATAAKDGKPASQVFKDTFEAIRSAPDDTKAAGVALDVFGARAGPKFAALIREGKLSYEEFAKAIETGSDTINQAASDTDDWREKLDILKNKALVLLEPIASSVFDGFTTVANWLIDTGLPKLGDAFGTVRDTLAPIVAAVAGWAQDAAWPAIVTAAETVGGAFQTAFGWVVDTGIPAVVGAFDTVKKWFEDNWPAIQAAFEDAWGKVQTGFEWLLDHKPVLIAALTAISLVIFGPLTTAIAAFVLAYMKLDGFRKVVDNIVSWLQDSLLPAFQDAWRWIRDNTAKLAAYISERWEAIKGSVTNIIKVLVVAVGIALAPLIFIWTHAHDQIMAVVNVVWKNIQLVVGTAIRVIKDIIDVVLGLLSGDWGMAWDAIKDIPAAAFEFMIGTVKLGIEAVKAIIEGVLVLLAALWQLAWDGLQTILSTAWEAMKTAVSTAIGVIIQFFTDLPGNIVTAVGDLLSLLVQKGKDLLQGLLDGIVAIWPSVSGWFAGLPEAVKTAITDVTQTLLQKGKDLLNGLWDGLLAVWHDVSNWFTSLPDAIVAAIGDLGLKLYEKGRELVQGFIDGIVSKAADVLVAIGDAIPFGLGDSGTKGAVFPTPKKSAGGNLFTHPSVTSIAENGAEAVINRNQALNLVWQMANTPPGASATEGSGGGHTFVTNVNGVAADPQELARMNAAEMTWMLRTQAA